MNGRFFVLGPCDGSAHADKFGMGGSVAYRAKSVGLWMDALNYTHPIMAANERSRNA